jgi:hypothetical protein
MPLELSSSIILELEQEKYLLNKKLIQLLLLLKYFLSYFVPTIDLKKFSLYEEKHEIIRY